MDLKQTDMKFRAAEILYFIKHDFWYPADQRTNTRCATSTWCIGPKGRILWTRSTATLLAHLSSIGAGSDFAIFQRMHRHSTNKVFTWHRDQRGKKKTRKGPGTERDLRWRRVEKSNRGLFANLKSRWCYFHWKLGRYYFSTSVTVQDSRTQNHLKIFQNSLKVKRSFRTSSDGCIQKTDTLFQELSRNEYTARLLPKTKHSIAERHFVVDSKFIYGCCRCPVPTPCDSFDRSCVLSFILPWNSWISNSRGE